jgi:hypothetical protein
MVTIKFVLIDNEGRHFIHVWFHNKHKANVNIESLQTLRMARRSGTQGRTWSRTPPRRPDMQHTWQQAWYVCCNLGPQHGIRLVDAGAKAPACRMTTSRPLENTMDWLASRQHGATAP